MRFKMKVMLLGVNLIRNCTLNRPIRSMCLSVENYSVVKKGVERMLPNELKEELKNKMKGDERVSVRRLQEIKLNLITRYNVTFDRTPVKSANDSKEYLVMRLTNNLTALLISDVTNLVDASEFRMDGKTFGEIIEYSNKGGIKIDDAKGKEKLAACSLTVGAGSFDDPEHIPGLAHLLEHMVFMGSEKFPNENDFNSFVVSRGGTNNASTDTEGTTFFFDCPEVHMEETLDRFANFFISPLMKQDTMVRERLAIESEFQMHSKNDALRTHQIIANTASSRNPGRKFMWGNLKTLRDDVKEDVLYDSLRNFWKVNYSASRMTVAVQARLPLSTLGRWVAEYFGKIPTNDRPDRMFPYVNPPFKASSFHKMYTVMPVADVNLLRLTWALPPVQHLYRSKPTLYQCFMLGYEGKGSLMSYLKKKLWALNVFAGNGNDGTENNSTFSLFSICVLLTENGLTSIDKVLLSVFAYLKMLRTHDPSETIFEEIKFLADTNFRFSPEIASSEYVQFVSQCMQLYPPVDYLTGSRLFFEGKMDQTANFLDLLTPEKVNVMLMSKKAAERVVLDKTEKWFQAKYNASPIPEKWLRDWKTCKLDSNFYLPPPNPFIPSNFEVLPSDDVRVDRPARLIHDKYMEMWYKQDKTFRLPFGFVNIYLISPQSLALPETFVLCELFTSVFSTVYDEELYPASVAGLDCSLSVAEYGFLLTVNGYNEKLTPFLDTILDSIVSVKKKLTLGLFEAVKDAQSKIYYNEMLNPSALAKELRLSLLCEPFCTSLIKLEVISKIDLQKLVAFCDAFFGNLYVKCLIQGNLSRDQALDISWKIRRKLNYDPLLVGSNPRIRVRQIPKGEHVLRVKALNAEDKNCYVVNYFQCGLSDRVDESCMIEMLMMNMAEPLFDTLRTKEQLGYFVANDTKYTYGVVGFTVAVKFQSDKFSVRHVEHRITDFLEKMRSHFLGMTVEEFNRLKASIKVLKLQADTQLADEVDRNWSEIETDEYMFDRLKREIKFLDSVQKQDLFTYFMDVLNDSSEGLSTADRRLRKLSIQVDASDLSSATQKPQRTHTSMYGPSQNKHALHIVDPDVRENGSKFIKDVEGFKNRMYIYPLPEFKL